MRNEADVNAYGDGFNIDFSAEELEVFREQYKYPLLLMHGVEADGEIRFFIVTFDEALALIAAASPDRSGVKGMNVPELNEFFKRFDFRDKDGNELLCNKEFQTIAATLGGRGV